MFAVKLLFCVSFIVGSRADGFEFNNPDGLQVSVVDENGESIYYSIDAMASFEWTPTTEYVTVTVKDSNGREKYTKSFRTSVQNDPMCNYALVVTEYDGYANYRSSLSSQHCTDDENIGNLALVVFDNGSDHPFYPSFARNGDPLAPDSNFGLMVPGDIRIYSPHDVYLSSPDVDIKMWDYVSIGVFDPYMGYFTCSENKVFFGRVFANFRKHNDGDRKCESNQELLEDAEETALAKENKSLQQANKALRKALEELAS